MALAMVEQDLGRAVADRVAKFLVLYARRPGYQSQFSDVLSAQTADDPQFAELIAWIRDRPVGRSRRIVGTHFLPPLRRRDRPNDGAVRPGRSAGACPHAAVDASAAQERGGAKRLGIDRVAQRGFQAAVRIDAFDVPQTSSDGRASSRPT
jgi:hypothetical protein